MAAGEQRGDAPAERVRDDHEPLDAERGRHGLDVAHQRVVVVASLRVPGRIAVPAVIEGQRAVVRADDGREVVPDVGLVAEAVEQEQGDALRAPFEQMEIEAPVAAHASRDRLHDATS